jgi:murein DD-endopeptidase MepM/ murein hydrolase activator NlpD
MKLKKWLLFPLLTLPSIHCAHRRSSDEPQAVAVPTRPENVILSTKDLESYQVEALGDVEGNWTKVATFLQNSKLLKANPAAPDDEEKYEMVGKVGTFVYLGDSIDNGKQNQKVLRFFTSLKKRYPTRVVLILGNRDINKLRFLWELKDAALKMDDPATMNSLDRFRLTAWADEFAAFLKTNPTVDDAKPAYTHGQNIDTDKVLKTKFLLAKTLGCVPTFGFLKEELGNPADIEVVHYLENLAQKGGLLNTYLHMAQVIYYDKYTKTLFMHGGIPQDNVGFVPGAGKKDFTDKTGMIAWTEALNKWAQARILDAEKGDIEKAIPLIQYQEPVIQTLANGKTSWGSTPNPESVVLARPWLADFNISMIRDDIQTQLLAAGVTRLVFGHSPVGDVPVFMKNGQFEMIDADTTQALQPHNGTVVITPKGAQVLATFNTYKPQTAGKPAGPGAEIISSTNLLYESTDPTLGSQSTVAPDRLQWALGTTMSSETPKQRLRVLFSKSPFGPFSVPTYSPLTAD